MNAFFRRSALPIAAVLLETTAPATADAFSDTSWTSADGVTIWATLLGTGGNVVVLECAGTKYRVPASRLSPAKRGEKMERLLGARPATPKVASRTPAPRPAAARLPVRPVSGSAGGCACDRHAMPVYPIWVRRRVVRTTAYACSEADHLVFGDKSAAGSRLRATGAVRSVATDRSIYPPGTVFSIQGMPGVHEVDDYGSALTGTGTIDIFQPTRAAMNLWDRRNVELTVIRRGSVARSARILSGRQGYWHCRAMLSSIDRQRRDPTATACR